MIASNVGSSGTIEILSGGGLTGTGTFAIGDSGTGTLNILNGGTSSNTDSVLGFTVAGIGTATVDNATWTNSGTLTVGRNGSGTLNISNGGQVSSNEGVIAGLTTNSSGIVTVDGSNGIDPSTWTIAIALYVGQAGDGTLTIQNGGVVSIDFALTLANLSNSTGTLNLNTGGVLQIGRLNSFTVGNGTAAFNFAGGTIEVKDHDLSTSVNAVLSGTTSTIDTHGLNATFFGDFSGAGALSKTGAGVLTLSGTNTYQGATTIAAETLRAGSATGLSAASAFTVDATAQLDLNGFSNTIGSLAGAGTVTNAGAAAAILTTGGDNTGTVFSGILQDGTSPLGLTKTGAGIFSISGPNTYTGPTTVTGGTLRAGSAASFSAASTFAVDAGSLLDLNGFSSTLGSLAGAGTVTNGAAAAVVLTVGKDNTSTVFTGIIQDGTGPVSLTKIGTGALRLAGASTYTGDTLVNEGSLIVNGSIASPMTTVNIAGLIGGGGTIGGALINNGTVSPGNSPGTLVVKGSFTQSSTGTLRIEVGGRNLGQHDLLAVGGAATLAGKLQLVRLNNFQLQEGDHIVFLTAGGGLSGTFAPENSDFSTGTIVAGKVVYGANEVALEAVPQPFADVMKLMGLPSGLTPNQRAVAKALDSAAGDPRAGKLFEYLNTRPLEKLPGDFDLIAPEELTAIYQTSISLATVQSLNLQRRTEDLRSGASGFSAAGLAINGQTPSYSGSLRSGATGPSGGERSGSQELKQDKEIAPEADRWGAFLSGTGEWVDVSGDGNARGYDITTGGFTLGLDYKVTPNFAIGVSAGYAGTGADLTNDGRVRINGGKVGLYATYFAGNFYADLAANGGLNSYETRRGGLQGAARGDTEGDEVNVLLGTGYDFKCGPLKIGPTATFNYTRVAIDDFTERGSLAPLSFPDQSAESIRSAFGVKASYDWKIGGVIVKPELRAAWQHEYGDTSYALDSSFANGAGNVFSVTGPRIGRDSALVSAGFAVQLNDRCSTYLYYDGQFGRDNYESHSISGGVRLEF